MKNIKSSLTAAVLLATCFAFAGVLHADVIEQVLVRVNGEIFTKSDLENSQVDALRQMGQQGDVKAKDLGDAQLRKTLDQLTPQILTTVVNDMLLLQRANDLGYKVTEEQFTSVVDSIKKDNKWTTDAELTAALAQEKPPMTMADLRKNIEKSVLRDRVRQSEVFSKIGISDEEARAYYNAHISEFTKPEEVTLREILVAVPATGSTVNVAAEDAAKAKIDGLRVRALNGDSFEKLAADFSTAPSAANAGLIGPLNLSDISGDLRKLLEQMKVGDVTTPLRTAAGFQLLKLESRTDAEVTPFEKARDAIGDKVFTGKRQEEYEKYLDKLRAQAIIDWKNDDIKKAYEQGVAQEKTTAAAAASAPPSAVQ